MDKEKLIQIIKESLEKAQIPGTPEYFESIARVEAHIANEQEKEKKLVEKYFPECVGHSMEKDNWKHFDAMFVSVDFVCSCGKTHTVTREMMK